MVDTISLIIVTVNMPLKFGQVVIICLFTVGKLRFRESNIYSSSLNSHRVDLKLCLRFSAPGSFRRTTLNLR